jgi:drug/metabolite transporter (DMT)-like permease
MTMEPVFAASFAIVLGDEGLGWRLLIGGAFVLTAMVFAESSGRKPVRVPPDS